MFSETRQQYDLPLSMRLPQETPIPYRKCVATILCIPEGLSIFVGKSTTNRNGWKNAGFSSHVWWNSMVQVVAVSLIVDDLY